MTEANTPPRAPPNYTTQPEDAIAISVHAENTIRMRSIRRAIAINAVEAAREHRGERDDPFNQSDADTVVAIMELLDRVAGG